MIGRTAAAFLLVLLSACGRDESNAPAPDPTPRPTHVAAIDFNRDVRPILADRCFRCHGPDSGARKRGLRLDTPDGATALLKSGARAVVPGDAAASEAARRIQSHDPDEIMPPPEMQRPLSAADKDVLLRWIGAGAEYKPHWAFVPPKAEKPGAVRSAPWCTDDIDRFVLARLESEGLSPAPEADRAALLRRASLALTGLPPTPEETSDFIADASPGAFERCVDRLLASPAYGERMTADWLDIARFADTFGYQSDWECRTWPWRDWAIKAFNDDIPYDAFVREVIAGDLLPDATLAQKVATAFNRLHRQTNEGGSIDEEFRQEYTSDRVHTFGTAFLGMTLECARCHDHKYDPVPQTSYYSLCAFFGGIDEAGTYPYTTGATPRPAVRLPSSQQETELTKRAAAVAAKEAAYRAAREASRGACAAWLAGSPQATPAPPVKRFALEGAVEGPMGKATSFDGDSGASFDDAPAFRRCDAYSLAFWMRCPDLKSRATIIHTSRFTIEADQQGYQVMLKDGRLCWEIVHFWPGSAAAIRTTDPFPLGRWVHVAVTYDGSSRAGGLRIYLDGAPAGVETVRDHLDGPAHIRAFQIGFRDRDVGFKDGAVGDVQIFDRALTPLETAELLKPGALAAAIADGGRGNIGAPLEEYVASIDPACRDAARALRDARAAHQDLLESVPELMVMEESALPREFFVLTRGAYDQPDRTRPVRADRAIDALLPFDASWPRNRLGLATWLTDPRHPLLARVEVNRLWAMCFGRGLVATQENFGVQGESPSHPELLDRLAADFMADGWNVKRMLRRIVLSSTFRQDSTSSAEKVASDPQNILLSRGPSFRISGEMLRDQALAASGLLATTIGGPSVKPWQPPGLWEDAGASGGYQPDSGANAHRRSLYTYRKRTAPPPNMLAFDAGSREQCLARRQATNTPLQPLVLLNDPVFFECARALAARATNEAADPRARIERAFRLLSARRPRDAELAALNDLYHEQAAAYALDPTAARAVLASQDADPALAALTLVCSTLMASDAIVTSR